MGDVEKSAKGDPKDNKRFSLAVGHNHELNAVRAQREQQKAKQKQRTKQEMREYIQKLQISEGQGQQQPQQQTQEEQPESGNEQQNSNQNGSQPMKDTPAKSSNVGNGVDYKQSDTQERRLSDTSKAMVDKYHNEYGNVKQFMQTQHAHDPTTAAIIQRQMSMDSNGDKSETEAKSNHGGSKIANMIFGSKPKSRKKKKVVYTVNNEKYILYSYYKPVRQIGDGAYATVMLRCFLIIIFFFFFFLFEGDCKYIYILFV